MTRSHAAVTRSRRALTRSSQAQARSGGAVTTFRSIPTHSRSPSVGDRGSGSVLIVALLSAVFTMTAVGPGTVVTPERQGEFYCARLSAPSAFAPFAAAGLTLGARSCALGSVLPETGP